jgi:hypothetical protein
VVDVVVAIWTGQAVIAGFCVGFCEPSAQVSYILANLALELAGPVVVFHICQHVFHICQHEKHN